jgi:hypothetical protein
MNKKDLKLYTLFNCNAKKFKSFYSTQFFHLFIYEIKNQYTEDEMKEFLKRNPDWLEYLI